MVNCDHIFDTALRNERMFYDSESEWHVETIRRVCQVTARLMLQMIIKHDNHNFFLH